jgi:hypothetical protein
MFGVPHIPKFDVSNFGIGTLGPVVVEVIGVPALEVRRVLTEHGSKPARSQAQRRGDELFSRIAA